jgi:hypothetical protein
MACAAGMPLASGRAVLASFGSPFFRASRGKAANGKQKYYAAAGRICMNHRESSAVISYANNDDIPAI